MTDTLPQSWPAPDTPRPVVIFGAGSIVRDAHLPAYAKGGYRVAGIYDPDLSKARELAAVQGCAVYSTMDEAAAVPDAVFDLATPPAAHAGVLAALPRGSAVLVQKPFGADLAAATEVLKVCRDRDLTAAVNFQLRFAPMMIALKAAIDRGDLGQIVDIEMHGVLDTPWELWSFLDGLPRIEITMHSIHYLDLIRHLVGAPRGVHACSLGHPSHKVAQTRTSAILDYGPDLRCTLSINHDWVFGPDHQVCELRVAGTKGAAFAQLGVNLNYPKGAPDILRICRKGEDWCDVPLSGAWFPDAFVGRMHNLQRAAAGSEPLVSDAGDSWKTMALVEACYASARQPATPIEDLT
ncbi:MULTISPECIES: Gfo/Idh/MocA family protein [Roseobacteraceae]|uniref:Putative oxidoreductase YhhX n=1 Tax=Pseudosulfitobacter pseudonitzschiae TaxID=1402135 RepID=A0A221K5P5_9RHOB|nr:MULTISPECIES: Gfo/Idh/MocA family oxidoreductase [Roseobacteraceae]ASM74306.1 putative oxidoreductase YhhX [Pseudosulfitobacter pseudonitzschiae]